MRNKKANILLLTILLLLNIVNADNRRYVWTYEYITMEPGKAELEHYLTFQGKDRMHTKDAVKVVHNLELEIGMNERFDVGIYQNFSQSPGKAFQYDGYKIRTRYRIGEKGQYLVDPLLYFEYKGNTDFSKHVYEGKLILARDFGSVNAAINPVFEIEAEDSFDDTGDSAFFVPFHAIGLDHPDALEGLFQQRSEQAHFLLGVGRDFPHPPPEVQDRQRRHGENKNTDRR